MDPHSQSFSPQNLKRIWDRELRRGKALPHDLRAAAGPAVPPLLVPILENIDRTRDLRVTLKAARKLDDATAIASAREAVQEAVRERDTLAMAFLQTISARLSTARFQVAIRRVSDLGGKEIYRVGGDPVEGYFAIKQISANLKSANEVHPSGRDQIVGQLISALDNKASKYVVRLDVTSFYENVSHARLMSWLEDLRLLSPSTLRQIDGILKQHSDLTDGSPGMGLPRGIGLSAYLAELYMQEFDAHIKRLPETIFYGRFVDDIIGVFSSSHIERGGSRTFEDLLVEQLAAIGLTPSTNPEKRMIAHKPNKRAPLAKLKYLGYEIEQPDPQQALEVRLTQARMDVLKKRMEVAFAAYTQTPSGLAARLLIQRIDFMTSNTRLQNNKRHAFLGVYYSHRYLRGHQQLADLDAHLANLRSSVVDVNVRARLDLFSFSASFATKRFRRWRPSSMKAMRSVWSGRG
jgi:hypothetical protein